MFYSAKADSNAQFLSTNSGGVFMKTAKTTTQEIDSTIGSKVFPSQSVLLSSHRKGINARTSRPEREEGNNPCSVKRDRSKMSFEGYYFISLSFEEMMERLWILDMV